MSAGATESEWESLSQPGSVATQSSGAEGHDWDDDSNPGEVEMPTLSDTCFGDPAIYATYVRSSVGFKVTREKPVNRLEFLSDIPPVWPVPREPTAYFLNLSSADYDVVKQSSKGTAAKGPMPLNTLVNDEVSLPFALQIFVAEPELFRIRTKTLTAQHRARVKPSCQWSLFFRRWWFFGGARGTPGSSVEVQVQWSFCVHRLQLRSEGYQKIRGGHGPTKGDN